VDDFDSAFPELFAVAYRVAYRSMGSSTQAEEIAQETLTRALSRWNSIHDYAPAWVATVALRVAIDTGREASRRRRVPLTDQPAAVEDLERRVDLHVALRKLPKRQRQALACRYLADLPDEETARLLQVSVGSVKQHAARGLAALRGKTLTAEEGDCYA
jgi:RNA polymerase sigma factor (sigma-70 family)